MPFTAIQSPEKLSYCSYQKVSWTISLIDSLGSPRLKRSGSEGIERISS